MIKPLEIAEKSMLFAQEDSEFYWRESSKLAYYSVYHHLSYIADSFSINTSQYKGGVHKRLLEGIKRMSDDGFDLEYYANKMKKSRVLADYYLEQDFSKRDALVQQDNLNICNDLIVKILQEKDESVNS